MSFLQKNRVLNWVHGIETNQRHELNTLHQRICIMGKNKQTITIEDVKRVQRAADRSGDPDKIAFMKRFQRAYAKQQGGQNGPKK